MSLSDLACPVGPEGTADKAASLRRNQSARQYLTNIRENSQIQMQSQISFPAGSKKAQQQATFVCPRVIQKAQHHGLCRHLRRRGRAFRQQRCSTTSGHYIELPTRGRCPHRDSAGGCPIPMKPSGSAQASLAGVSALVREFATTCAVLAHTLFSVLSSNFCTSDVHG